MLIIKIKDKNLENIIKKKHRYYFVNSKYWYFYYFKYFYWKRGYHYYFKYKENGEKLKNLVEVLKKIDIRI